MSGESISPVLNRASVRRVGQLLWVATREFFRHNGPTWAAAIAYYSLLSIFPLLLAGASVASFFVDSQWAAREATERLGEFLPQGQGEIGRVVRQTLASGRSGGLFFIVPLLWTGSLVFGAIAKALNRANAPGTNPKFWKRLLIRFLMLLTVGVVFLVALLAPGVARLLWLTLGNLPIGGRWIFYIVVNAVPPLFLLTGFLAVYRFVSSPRPGWRSAFFGAAVAMVLFIAAKPLFLGYVRDLARYNIVYGSLAGVVVFVLWAWVVAMIGLFGGEVSSQSRPLFVDEEADAPASPDKP